MNDWSGNYHSVCGCLGARNECKEPRAEHDFYATQPIAATWLMKIETLSPKIWECACGEGHLAKPFMQNGYDVLCTDLIDRGFGTGGVDFLKCETPFEGDIITNPPYKYAQDFVEHALNLITENHKVCMFLKVQFMEGKSRRRLFDTFPPRTIWVSSSRIQCGRNGVFSGNMVAYAWYVWEKGFKGTTQLKWFN